MGWIKVIIHRDNKHLSKAERLANVGYETLCNQFLETESLLHMGTNTKRKDLKQQVTRKNSLKGAKLYKGFNPLVTATLKYGF